MKSEQVREFFRLRRARLVPADLGLGGPGQLRRVTGLRREEVAERAGISVEYYTRIERGSLEGVSDGVLHGLAFALCLDHSEVAFLHQLARGLHGCTVERPPTPVAASAGVRQVVWGITEMPVFATNARLDLLAINELGSKLFFDQPAASAEGAAGRGPVVNLARFCFEDPHAKQLYANWHAVANITVSLLRLGRGCDSAIDQPTDALIRELQQHSDEFRRQWEMFDVTERFAGELEVEDAEIGTLRLQFEQFHAASQPGVTVHMLNAAPGTPSQARLRALAAHLADRAHAPAS